MSTKNPGIDVCLQIINTAIEEQLPLYKASKKLGKGKNYVYDMNKKIDERIQAKVITKTAGNEFKRAMKKYQSA